MTTSIPTGALSRTAPLACMSRMGVMSSRDRAGHPSPAVQAGRAVMLNEFRWHTGHADVWRIFTQAAALAAVVDGLADPWRGTGVTHVVGIESRGFLLGAAVAVNLGVGFQAVRKSDGMLPGPKLSAVSAADYRGHEHLLRMQNVIGPGDVGLLVDDWAERGAQARAVCELVELAGARFAGVSVLVDQLSDDVRATLGRVTSLVRAADLGDPEAR